ncbi:MULTISPECIES: Na+/H+ antiporter NhaA [unclassified Methylobacterium]|uniref:Na+/H+ antiporter NhaA n=1 Tax=unclassified Methylobacterium TaxID=2615210 RepID=UPI001FB9B18B|nr:MULTISPECIES: Na+/H+ antiporter NhaA [unclassified Methylobacterium]MCJ2020923.1 Na+/H+ antiporter NhaA [Methylobacterium sp. E-065]MCJ2040901.1 Na+/H+ antiporter NhaA [Methylobacterium sp. J-059]MCJ2077575.1 Na+/H+ antiporter NhaA [Methylobacterium sp. E-016]MCJ2107239.1 Na+/H+ antiporter NhaA [Methylobacterium sp. E-041]MCJ2114234.1 Na+/H+ antiporter NhaA [Methylobacterium sp. E-025]
MPRRLRPTSALRNVLRGEASGGLILMASAALALAIANSGWSGVYFSVLKTYVATACLNGDIRLRVT